MDEEPRTEERQIYKLVKKGSYKLRANRQLDISEQELQMKIYEVRTADEDWEAAGRRGYRAVTYATVPHYVAGHKNPIGSVERKIEVVVNGPSISKARSKIGKEIAFAFERRIPRRKKKNRRVGHRWGGW
jgi:hypothetical protein